VYLVGERRSTTAQPVQPGASASVSPTGPTGPGKPTAPPSLLPTHDPTLNWQMYKNSEFGFTFKYPSGYAYDAVGPNYFQRQLDAGESISGTVAPSYDTIQFQGEPHSFTLGIFHSVPEYDVAELNPPLDGSCGSQFRTTLSTTVRHIGRRPYREVIQSQTGSKENDLNVSLCWLNNRHHLLVLSARSIASGDIDPTLLFLRTVLSSFQDPKATP